MQRHKLFFSKRHISFVAAAQADCLLFMVGGSQIIGAAVKTFLYITHGGRHFFI